jgi:hypothetical protein
LTPLAKVEMYNSAKNAIDIDSPRWNSDSSNSDHDQNQEFLDEIDKVNPEKLANNRDL